MISNHGWLIIDDHREKMSDASVTDSGGDDVVVEVKIKGDIPPFRGAASVALIVTMEGKC